MNYEPPPTITSTANRVVGGVGDRGGDALRALGFELFCFISSDGKFQCGPNLGRCNRQRFRQSISLRCPYANQRSAKYLVVWHSLLVPTAFVPCGNCNSLDALAI